MSPEFWLAIIGISGTLLATIIPQYFTSKKDARDRQQWYAEFALKRRYEALNDLYAKATTCLRQAEERTLQFNKEPTAVMLELFNGHRAVQDAFNFASTYLDSKTTSITENLIAILSEYVLLSMDNVQKIRIKKDSPPTPDELTKLDEVWKKAKSSLLELRDALKPILNPPIVDRYLEDISRS
jgi:hypothetical protein